MDNNGFVPSSILLPKKKMDEKECIFCNPKNVILENDNAVAVMDGYPCSDGHMLIIPKRHARDFFELTDFEVASMFLLSFDANKYIEKKYHPSGYNIGFNVGESGGQTIPHCHMHIIPRYDGDVEDPRGGIRGVIPQKQKY